MRQKQDITAIIYDKKGHVLSIGKNSYVKTHPLQAKYAKQLGEENKVFLHAELAAIIRCKDLSKADKIQIFRVGRSGNFATAKPCKICQLAIREAGIKKIEHS